MTQGTYEFDICLKFNGTAKVKAPSKRQALEALKILERRFMKLSHTTSGLLTTSISVLASAEERI